MGDEPSVKPVYSWTEEQILEIKKQTSRIEALELLLVGRLVMDFASEKLRDVQVGFDRILGNVGLVVGMIGLSFAIYTLGKEEQDYTFLIFSLATVLFALALVAMILGQLIHWPNERRKAAKELKELMDIPYVKDKMKEWKVKK